MFIVEFSEKRCRAVTIRSMEERAAAQRKELTERGRKMIGKWRRIADPTPAVQDQIWEFLYEYTRSAVTQMLLYESTAIPDADEVGTMTAEMIGILYPQGDYAAEILARIGFIAECALVAAKPGEHDRYSPLDTLCAFRRMLGRHLWENGEIVRKLKRCRSDYAAAVVRSLHKVELEQSRYDSWEMSYLECERRYHQILNRIGEISRPAGRSVYDPRSPWELRQIVRIGITAREERPVQPDRVPRWSGIRHLRQLVSKRPAGGDLPPHGPVREK